MGYFDGLHGVSVLPAPLANHCGLILRSKLFISVVILEKIGIVLAGVFYEPDHDDNPEVEDEDAGVLLLEHHGDADDHQEGYHYDDYVVAGLLKETKVGTGLLVFVEDRQLVGVE